MLQPSKKGMSEQEPLKVAELPFVAVSLPNSKTTLIDGPKEWNSGLRFAGS